MFYRGVNIYADLLAPKSESNPKGTDCQASLIDLFNGDVVTFDKIYELDQPMAVHEKSGEEVEAGIKFLNDTDLDTENGVENNNQDIFYVGVQGALDQVKGLIDTVDPSSPTGLVATFDDVITLFDNANPTFDLATFILNAQTLLQTANELLNAHFFIPTYEPYIITSGDAKVTIKPLNMLQNVVLNEQQKSKFMPGSEID